MKAPRHSAENIDVDDVNRWTSILLTIPLAVRDRDAGGHVRRGLRFGPNWLASYVRNFDLDTGEVWVMASAAKSDACRLAVTR